MPRDWYDGVSLTVEAALSSATGPCGLWGSGSVADPSLWGSALWGPDESFIDVSAYLRAAETDRGFSAEVQRWDTGTGSVTLGNTDGRFSSSNLAGPYVAAGVSGVRPMVPIRIRATYAGVTYPLMRMYAQRWIRGYSEADRDAWVTVPGTDEWDRLSNAGGVALGSPVGAGELFGTRVHRVLDAAGHTGSRAVDLGTIAMVATDLGSKAATELALIADSEGGAVYIGEDGAVIAERQYALVENARSIIPQAIFGEGPGEIPYAALTPDDGIATTKNLISYQRVGGAPQVASDAVSRALYGDRTDPRTDLLCATDAQAAQLATWKLARYRAPEDRFSTMTLRPRHAVYGSRLWPQVLGRRVRDLVQIWRRPPGEPAMTRLCHIAGIKHEITQDDWTTTWRLWSATPYTRFASSRWDAGTWATGADDLSSSVWFF